VVNFSPLLASLGHPSKFQQVSPLDCVTARHSSSGRQANYGIEQTALPIFGRAVILFGIGPHSTLCSERKHPLVFSFMTSSQINQFAQKFQHL